jgi:histidinol-phosphate aminotransferase
VPLLEEFPNLIITRTFSKAMGGAGLRLGYLLGQQEVVAEINKIKLPYNINFFSEHVATVLLSQRQWMEERVGEIISERARLQEFLQTMPLTNVYESAANFILIRTERKEDLFSHAQDAGILLRDVSSYPMLDRCLRISVGTREENDRLMRALGDFFGTS